VLTTGPTGVTSRHKTIFFTPLFKLGKSGKVDAKALVAVDEEFLRALTRRALQEVEAEMTEVVSPCEEPGNFGNQVLFKTFAERSAYQSRFRTGTQASPRKPLRTLKSQAGY
jgi:hypothetical protein